MLPSAGQSGFLCLPLTVFAARCFAHIPYELNGQLQGGTKCTTVYFLLHILLVFEKI